MIELNKHIEILLLSNDCVIIPNFGGFMAHYVDAYFDEESASFVPPTRMLGFNPQLKVNDHLLVQSYIEAYDISYPEALRRIEDEIEELRQHLQNEGEYELENLGILRINEEGNYIFTSCEAGVLTPTIYGLGSFGIKDLAAIALDNEIKANKTEVKIEELESKAQEVSIDVKEIVEKNNAKEDRETSATLDDNEALVIKMRWIRNIVAASIAIVAFFLIGSPVANDQPQPHIQQSSIFALSQETVNHIEATTVQCETEEPTAIENDNKATNATEAIVSKKESVAPVSVSSTIKKETVSKSIETVTSKESVKVSTSSKDIEPIVKKKYGIVLASQTARKNAEIFVNSLKEQGIDAQIVDMEGTNKVRVVYGAFTSNEEAHAQLMKMRAANSLIFKEAWVLRAFK